VSTLQMSQVECARGKESDGYISDHSITLSVLTEKNIGRARAGADTQDTDTTTTTKKMKTSKKKKKECIVCADNQMGHQW
jgi:hypothetical protein